MANQILDSMTLIEARNSFRKALDSLYIRREIDDIFKRAISFYFNWPAVKIGLEPQFLLNTDQFACLETLRERLEKGTPFQYITGITNFRGIDLEVSPAVLIPRPETEELVSWVLEEEKNVQQKVWDLCTGSGCVAIALKKERPKWDLLGVDLSNDALEVAQKNTKKHKVSVSLIQHNLLDWTADGMQSDLMVCNPPYVLPSEQKQMHSNVLNFEPSMALFVPEEDPLLFYRSILTLGKHNLSKDGAIYFEINPLCVKDLLTLGKTMGYRHARVKKDIFGKERFVKFSLLTI